MRYILMIIMAACVVGIWAYFYHFLKGRFQFYRTEVISKKENPERGNPETENSKTENSGKGNSKRVNRVIALCSAIFLVLCFLNFTSIFTLGVLHCIVIAMVLDIIHAIIKAFAGVKTQKAAGIRATEAKETKKAEAKAVKYQAEDLQPKKLQEKESPEKKPKQTAYRIWENLYGCGLIPVLLAAVMMGYGFYNIHHVVEKDYTVTTQKKIGEEGLKVAMISDLHYKTTMDAEKLAKIAEEIEAKNPDLVVLCGDLVDESTTYEQMQEAFEVIGTIKSRYGTYFVYGNHDTQPYTNNKSFTKEQLQSTIEQAGIRVLEDEICQLGDNLVLVGRKDIGFDLEEPRLSLEELLEGVDPDSYILVLDHQPAKAAESKGAGADLQLSGHTHGGQIWPGGIVNDLAGIVNYGAEKEGDFEVIVSSGVAGWGYQVRTAYQCEWLLVTITDGQ
ncbi:MAG: metallophosphoesterase [Lachnospiraceae bacterium]|nr:metallophosphoesterase [Lachnospiraceae bacterium]